MTGWQELNKIDATIMGAVSREWHAERLREAQRERLLRGRFDAPASRPARGRVLATALLAALAAALLIGLAVAAAGGAGPLALGGLL